MIASGWRGIEHLGQAVIRPLAGLIEELDFFAVVLMSAGSLRRGEWPVRRDRPGGAEERFSGA